MTNQPEQQAKASSRSLSLIAMPYTFTQDELLNTDGFIKAAKERGYHITLDDLQTFHSNNLLVPFYRVSDEADTDQRIDVEANGNADYRWQALKAAQDGRLRDSASEDYSTAWPYRRPADKQGDRWWNGFLFSSWQLLDLHMVTTSKKPCRRVEMYSFGQS